MRTSPDSGDSIPPQDGEVRNTGQAAFLWAIQGSENIVYDIARPARITMVQAAMDTSPATRAGNGGRGAEPQPAMVRSVTR